MFEELRGKHCATFEPHVVGQALPRVDGRLKVTGAAEFTAEHHPDGLVYGVVIGNAIARGRVVSVKTSAAEALPGVVVVISHASAPKLKPLPPEWERVKSYALDVTAP